MTGGSTGNTVSLHIRLVLSIGRTYNIAKKKKGTNINEGKDLISEFTLLVVSAQFSTKNNNNIYKEPGN
jgi:hypothetical protein